MRATVHKESKDLRVLATSDKLGLMFGHWARGVTALLARCVCGPINGMAIPFRAPGRIQPSWRVAVFSAAHDVGAAPAAYDPPHQPGSSTGATRSASVADSFDL